MFFAADMQKNLAYKRDFYCNIVLFSETYVCNWWWFDKTCHGNVALSSPMCAEEDGSVVIVVIIRR